MARQDSVTFDRDTDCIGGVSRTQTCRHAWREITTMHGRADYHRPVFAGAGPRRDERRERLAVVIGESGMLGDEHHVGATYFGGGRESNTPVMPVIVTQPIDTAALNAAVRSAIEQQLASLRPLLDSLAAQRVEISQEGDLIARYVVPVHFGFDSAAVRDSDLVVLGQIADIIRRVYPNALVTIEGFADPAGSTQYNLALSRRRANAVRDIMVSRFGLPSQQFRPVGYGEQQVRQVAPGARNQQAGAENNRRVSFTIDATQRF